MAVVLMVAAHRPVALIAVATAAVTEEAIEMIRAVCSPLPVMRFQQTSAEPLDCFVRRALPAGLRVFTSRLSGRTSARAHSLPSRSATSSAWRLVSTCVLQKFQCAHSPNQALQPTRMLVTFCAYAQPAPSTRVADL